jgi:hypothetical protein
MAKPFIVAAKTYFGLKDGQSLTEFKKECDQLTERDCAELAPLLAAAIGEEIALPIKSPAAA